MTADRLGAVLEEMRAHYEIYAARLAAWLESLPTAEQGAALDGLAAIETECVARARKLGDEAEALRRRAARARGRDVTLHTLAAEAGRTDTLVAARKAVASVARLRGQAVRAVEKLRDEAGDALARQAAARRLGERYNPLARSGKKIDGQA